MATISVTSDLDVAEKFRVLVKESLGGESAYIRAKETLEHIVETDKDMGSADKARMVAEVIGGIVNNINSSAMSTALQWSSQEKDIALRKLELAPQIDILENENLLKEAQTAQIDNAVRLAKVESRRLYGEGTFIGQDLQADALTNVGKIYEEIQLTNAQTSKVAKDEALVDQKIVESHAAIHKIVADTYVNYGHYDYDVPDATGITVVTPNHSHTTLSDTQQTIADEQAKGYTYNAWANALTGSASMLGTAIAAEYAEFSNPSTGYDLLQIVKDAATNLEGVTPPA